MDAVIYTVCIIQLNPHKIYKVGIMFFAVLLLRQPDYKEVKNLPEVTQLGCGRWEIPT